MSRFKYNLFLCFYPLNLTTVQSTMAYTIGFLTFVYVKINRIKLFREKIKV